MKRIFLVSSGIATMIFVAACQSSPVPTVATSPPTVTTAPPMTTVVPTTMVTPTTTVVPTTTVPATTIAPPTTTKPAVVNEPATAELIILDFGDYFEVTVLMFDSGGLPIHVKNSKPDSTNVYASVSVDYTYTDTLFFDDLTPIVIPKSKLGSKGTYKITVTVNYGSKVNYWSTVAKSTLEVK